MSKWPNAWIAPRSANPDDEKTLGHWCNGKSIGTFRSEKQQLNLYFALDQKLRIQDFEKMILAHPYYLPGTLA